MVKRTVPTKLSSRKKHSVKRATPPRFRLPLALLFMLLMILGGTIIWLTRAATSTPYSYNAATQTHSGRLLSDDAPVNQLIPGDVRYLTDSQTRLSAAPTPGQMSLLDWSWPIFDADATTPKARVWCYVSPCDAIAAAPVPIPNGIFAQVGGDKHVAVIDNSTRKMYSYWVWKDCFLQPNPISAKWCPGSGIVTSIDGNGVGGGNNVAKLAGGIVRTYEIEQGHIDHALTFGTTNSCKGDPVYPAKNSDGVTTDQSICITIGSRIQLDPSVNVDALPISSMEKMIARAMQKYGAYCDDTGGSMGYWIELDRTGRKVYQAAGAPDKNQFVLAGIPWNKVKIIQPQWNTDGSKAYAWGSVAPPSQGSTSGGVTSGGKGGGTGGATSGGPGSSGSTSSGSGAGSSNSTQNGSSASQSTGTPSTSGSSGSTYTVHNSTANNEDMMAAVKTSFLFVNRSEITWPKIDGATSYRVRVNNGVARQTDKLTYAYWHFGGFQQDVHVQALDAAGQNVGDEQQYIFRPNCAWYGICKD